VSVNWNDEQARCGLALGILDNEPDAHRILGDLLEEDGETGLAQWARSKKNGRRKRLDIVLAILHPQLSVRLATEFMSHILPQISPPYILDSITTAVAELRDWSSTLAINATLRRSVDCLLPVTAMNIPCHHHFLEGCPSEDKWQLGLALKALANCAMLAARCEREPCSQTARRLTNDSALQARNVAKHTRDEVCYHMPLVPRDQQHRGYGAADSRYVYHRYSSKPYSNELTWQTDHTRAMLEEECSR
jgi:hypothetical protein